MLIIPEIETVAILVPRTGSGSLRRAVHAHYPEAMQIYRHMEADGVPAGYDRWRRVGVVRDPVDRLWSLYKFLRRPTTPTALTYPDHFLAMARTVQRPFEDWLLHNEAVFTSPYDSTTKGRYYPQFNVRHALPENRKSQFLYPRPDLGTKVYPFYRLDKLRRDLGLPQMERHNATDSESCPHLSDDARIYVNQVFAWDFEAAS